MSKPKSDSEILSEIIKIMHTAFHSEDSEWGYNLERIYSLVETTKEYKEIERQYQLDLKQDKILELSRKQKKAEEESQRLMIELEALKTEN